MMAVRGVLEVGGEDLGVSQLFRGDGNWCAISKFLIVYCFEVGREDLHRFREDELAVTDAHYRII